LAGICAFIAKLNCGRAGGNRGTHHIDYGTGCGQA
jgi:hypothetical protein